jgi:hypothetical protein
LGCGPVCGSQAYSGRSIVLSGGRLIDGNGGAPRPNGYLLTSIDDARAKVNDLLDNGVDVIKVYLEDGSIIGKTDVLVVDGDPLTDLNVLKNNRVLVLHNGRVAFSRLTSGFVFRKRIP